MSVCVDISVPVLLVDDDDESSDESSSSDELLESLMTYIEGKFDIKRKKICHFLNFNMIQNLEKCYITIY